MVFNDVFSKSIQSMPIYTNHTIKNFNLPSNRILCVKFTTRTKILWLPFEDFGFMNFMADQTTSIQIEQRNRIRKVFWSEIVSESFNFLFFRVFVWEKFWTCSGITFFIIKLNVFKSIILSNKDFKLLINHKLKLFASHPISQNHDQWNVWR